MIRSILTFFTGVFLCTGCLTSHDPQIIVDKSIKRHGFDKLNDHSVLFSFRDKEYSISTYKDKPLFTRSFQLDTVRVVDSLANYTQFKRYKNGSLVTLTPIQRKKYTNSLNSVFYFFTLPKGLNDQAVKKEFIEQNILHGTVYNKIKITFSQFQGGEDYQDEFLYWFNEKTGELDFMAYSYSVNGGGIRFRKAFNKRKIDGVLFQDYMNYKPVSTDITLTELDDLFEQGELIEVSQIINTDIQILP